jgi:hypothetical protein
MAVGHLYQSDLNQSRDWFELKTLHFVKVDYKMLLFRLQLKCLAGSDLLNAAHLYQSNLNQS